MHSLVVRMPSLLKSALVGKPRPGDHFRLAGDRNGPHPSKERIGQDAMSQRLGLERLLAPPRGHDVRRSDLPRRDFHPFLERADLGVVEDRLGLASVDDHQAIEGFEPHQVKGHHRIRQHVLGIDLDFPLVRSGPPARPPGWALIRERKRREQ